MTERQTENPPGALKDLMPQLKQAYILFSAGEITERISRETLRTSHPDEAEHVVNHYRLAAKSAVSDLNTYEYKLDSCARNIVDSLADLTPEERLTWLKGIFTLASTVAETDVTSDETASKRHRRNLFIRGLFRSLHTALAKRKRNVQPGTNPFTASAAPESADDRFDPESGLPKTTALRSLATWF